MRATLALLLMLLVDPSRLAACSIIAIPHEIDPAACAVDSVRPDRPSIRPGTITRGRGAVAQEGGAISMTSCDDIGFVALDFVEPPSDDRTPREQIGFAVVHLDGELPQGMRLPEQPLRAPGDAFTLHWIDGATNDQEPIDFSLALIAVDLAGNRSEPSEPVRVHHPGSRADE